jgi:2-pyrone-4,6-dicarboxylate lactonase
MCIKALHEISGRNEMSVAAGIAEKRKPTLNLPPLSCDAHCHVFGPAARFPFAANRTYTPEDAPKEALAALHRRLGIERVVIVQASCHGTDNSAMLDAIATSGGKYRGVALVDASFDEAELERLHAGGVRGVRFNFSPRLGGPPKPDVFRQVLARIAPLGWHVVLHLDGADLPERAELIRSIPLPIVIDHMGRIMTAGGLEQPAFRILLELARRETCWVKVCGSERNSSAGSPYHDAVPFAAALVKTAPDRVLWGTDWPHPNLTHPPDEADLVDLVPLFAPDESTRHKLLVDNPARLYGFPG